jgi:hypothetical protein
LEWWCSSVTPAETGADSPQKTKQNKKLPDNIENPDNVFWAMN